MKYLGIVVVMLALVGCSNTPSKLERIEANETAVTELQVNKADTAHVHESCPAQCDEKINRAFEKSQYK